MADSKITALTALTAADPANDMLPVVDVSDTSMAASGTTKRISINNILACSPSATLASATITGDLTVATNRLSVSSTGVQIGTTTNKTTAFTGNGTGLTIGGALAPTIALWDTTNASYVGSISQIDADMYLTNTGAGQMVFSTDNTSRYTISSTGISTWSVGGSTAMTLNSSVLAMGVTPNTWTVYKALQVQGASIFSTTGNDTGFGSNVYYDGGYKFRSASSDKATRYEQFGGSHSWHYTASPGTAGNTATFTQAMTLDASGSLLVGTTTSLQNTSHSFQALGTTNSFWAGTFQHDGTVGSPRLLGWRLPNSSDSNAYFVYAINSGGNCFNVFGNGSVNNSTGTYGTISDLRLKENISDARNYLADLLKLRVVKYSLKSEQSAVATKLGFVAQEVEQVFPTLVETNGDDVKSIKTSILIPMLLKAIQELTARVQTLEAK